MVVWRPGSLLKALLIWSAVTFIIFWLPAVRGVMDGSSYEWAGLFGMRGAGVGGDYWFPVLGSILAIGFLALGWRGARMPFPPLLLGWHGFLAAGATYLALSSPDDFRFQGDTLGVDVQLGWFGPLLFGGFFLMAIIWAARHWKSQEATAQPRWVRRNHQFAAGAAALLPLQFALLRFGPPHGATDQMGVVLTMLQWALVSAALYPWGSPGSVPAAEVGSRAGGRIPGPLLGQSGRRE